MGSQLRYLQTKKPLAPRVKAFRGILSIVNRTYDVRKVQGKHQVTKASTSFRGRRGVSLVY